MFIKCQKFSALAVHLERKLALQLVTPEISDIHVKHGSKKPKVPGACGQNGIS